MTFADVDAGIRATLAAYTHALDDGRTDDVVATFCPDGSIELPGTGTHEGTDALRAAYDSWKPLRPQRHVLANIHVFDWDEHEAKVTSDLVFLLKSKEDKWSVQLVGRYHDVLHHSIDDGGAGTWRFHRRVAEFL